MPFTRGQNAPPPAPMRRPMAAAPPAPVRRLIVQPPPPPPTFGGHSIGFGSPTYAGTAGIAASPPPRRGRVAAPPPPPPPPPPTRRHALPTGNNGTVGVIRVGTQSPVLKAANAGIIAAGGTAPVLKVAAAPAFDPMAVDLKNAVVSTGPQYGITSAGIVGVAGPGLTQAQYDQARQAQESAAYNTMATSANDKYLASLKGVLSPAAYADVAQSLVTGIAPKGQGYNYDTGQYDTPALSGYPSSRSRPSRGVRRHAVSTLGSYGADGLGGSGQDALGLNLGKIVGNIGKTVAKAAKDTVKAVDKAAVQTGHAVGDVAKSGAAQAIVGTVLAATGVGLPAAAAILATQKGVGTLIAPHGNLKTAAKGAATGAAEGAAASVAGSLVRKVAPNLTDLARGAVNKVLPGNPLSRVAKTTAAAAGMTSIAAIPLTTVDIPPVEMAAYNPADASPPPGFGPATPPGRRSTSTNPLTRAATAAGGLFAPPAAGPVHLPSTQYPGAGQYGSRPVAQPLSIAKRAAVGASVLKAGQSAKAGTDTAAAAVDKLTKKARQLQQSAALVAAAGNAAGSSQLTQLATQAFQLAGSVANGSASASSALQTAGLAAEGAAGGAVAGAGFGGVMLWAKENPALALGVGSAAAFALYQVVAGGGGRAPSSRDWR